MTEVIRVRTAEELEQAFQIRRIVFMEEQMVSEPDEFDGFDDDSHHFLAFFNGMPAGAARWRLIGDSVKLERFAVLKELRGNGIGAALVEQVVEDIHLSGFPFEQIFLHAQVEVIPFYVKFGFISKGEVFEECDILHQTMILPT